jgi:hypothetical protein
LQIKHLETGRKELTRRTASRILSLLILAVLIFSSLCCFAPAVSASSHPRNGAEAWNAGFRGIIEPQNPIVLQQLHSLCPLIDEEHFTVNFLSIYTYSMLVPYAYDYDVYGVSDYWQTSEETISLGRGDCEDQAINLATLIEALYKETYGYIPSNLVWVVIGHIVVLGAEGGHGWVLVNEGALPRETIEEIKSVSISEAIISIILGGYVNIQDLVTQIRHELEVNLDLSTLPSKNNQQLSLLYSGERYFELEPTWNLPVSEYYFKKYPYTEVYAIFNSQGYDPYPDFYPIEQPPYMGAEIKNIAFPLRVVVGDTFTINITVQNYDCGNLGADLVVILKNYGVEVTRKSAYVFKYWWQIQTFVFNLQAVEPAQKEELSVELFWHNYWPPFIDDWILEDFKNFTMQTISNKPDLVPYSGFTYPKNASEGQLLLFSVLGQNLGPMSAGSYAIDIFIDEAPFDRVTVTGCAGFSGFQTQTRPWVATAGTHSVRVVVDSTGVISEHNETNNEMIVSIDVRANKGSYVYSQVSTSSDDAQKWNNTSGGGWQWNLAYGMNVAGCPYALGGEDNFGCGLRFINITVPQKAKVTYARLELCASWDDESSVRTKIHGESTANALTFSTLADFNARDWTSAFVYWDDIPDWKTNEWYFTPDISEIIQEIVDRPDWKSGNSMAIIWEDFESRSISYIENSRRAWSYDANPTLAPRLLIDYEDITAPLITVISPENTTYLGSVPLTITTDEPVSWIGYSIDNQANVTIPGNVTLSSLPDGPHNIVVFANDTSNNIGVSERIFFNVRANETINHQVSWEGKIFQVVSLSNSTITPVPVVFDPLQKMISFKVTGPSGTFGFCNVKIPKALLSAKLTEWQITIDNVHIDAAISENTTHTLITFTYSHSTHSVAIIGKQIGLPQDLLVSINPASETVTLGQSMSFASTISGGTSPYSCQWYLNGNPVVEATSTVWIFKPSSVGIHYVYLKVTDSNNNTAQSETARIVVISVPVGGYSVSFDKYTTLKPLTLNFVLIIGLTLFLVFSNVRGRVLRRKRKYR